MWKDEVMVMVIVMVMVMVMVMVVVIVMVTVMVMAMVNALLEYIFSTTLHDRFQAHLFWTILCLGRWWFRTDHGESEGWRTTMGIEVLWRGI